MHIRDVVLNLHSMETLFQLKYEEKPAEPENRKSHITVYHLLVLLAHVNVVIPEWRRFAF